MPIKIGDEVRIHYTAKLENGEIIETTRDKGPLSVKIGSKKLIVGLDDALIGLEKGDKKEVTISPNKGFGERKENFLQEIPKEQFGERTEVSPGEVVELRYEDGKRRLVTIHEEREDSIVLDLNHPLAGETLTFEVEVIEISK